MTSSMQAAATVRVAMVTNIPAPYRLPVYERLVALGGVELCVFFCSGREPDREWDLQQTGVRQVFLKEKFLTWKGRFIHVNPDAWSALKRFRPDVVITTGFNPTFLVAYLYARLHGARHIAMTDGTAISEEVLGPIHRLVRRMVYRGSAAFIGASQGSFDLYQSYGIDRSRMFQSHLCADNGRFTPVPLAERSFDFVFSARFVAVKNPMFALDVCQAVARRLGRRVRILLLGSGELRSQMEAHAATMVQDVDAVFAGFAKQADLPALYASARVMLFPTTFDPWGVVANEACAAGVPVLVSPVAGAANDLIRDQVNGFVLPLDMDQWADAACRLLTDAALFDRMVQACLQEVSRFTYQHAAEGIRDAVLHAEGQAL